MMPPVRLSEIEQRLEAAGLLVHGATADATVIGVSDDTRQVARGDLFCAWQGTTFDSHDELPAVREAGAVAALVERRNEGLPLPQVVVRDGRRAAAIGAAFVFGDPQDALRLVGVTGTNGKTTTVWLLRHVLGARWPTASFGTLGVLLEDGTPLPDTDSLTTPGPVELARTLRLLVDRGAGAVAMEVSSHALHQGRVAALSFDVGVFTNLSRDHLDYHGTFEAYLEAKLSLLDHLRSQGWAAINGDDRAWADVTMRAPRVLRFGIDAPADVRATDVHLDSDGVRYTCTWDGRSVPFTLPLLGGFNVQNALAATTAALTQGLELEEIASRLSTVPQVPGRLERISTEPCPVLRDYAHTPDALERALTALRPLVPGRLIAVFGAGGDRDRGKRPMMGTIAERCADIAIVTSDNPRTEDPDAIIDEIAAGMEAAPVRITSRRDAIAHALRAAGPSDLILLAGKGHETYQVLGRESVPFDERVIVQELLAGMVTS
jgi:UDP-N-acetylmuramoyl-L-alanyl-D-glutamate--2,6-diaminopimelate ligase